MKSETAFPRPAGWKNDGWDDGAPGMSLREYACIKLKVPDSGHEWLDDLIQKSLLNDFAAKAMQALLTNPHVSPAAVKAAIYDLPTPAEGVAEVSRAFAEAMLKIKVREAADESTND